jgi:FkbM family methyltransferase
MEQIIHLYYQLKVFTGGKDIRSKFYLLINTLTKIPLFVIAGFSYRFNYIVDGYLPVITIKNRNGIFKCRKGSSDYWIVGDSFEIELKSYLEKKQPRIFVDIGANIGLYTIKMARQMGNNGKVIAIEADPENYEALVENIRLNELSNVHAFNLACWDKEEDVKLFMGLTKEKGISSVKEKVSGRMVVVHGNILDNILAGLEIKEVDMVKIDVEGAEEEVLLGMKETIANSNKIEILFEAWDESHLSGCREILIGYGLEIDERKFDKIMYQAKKVA